MRRHGALLSSFSESPAGIVSLELAQTKERTDLIVQAWAAHSSQNVVQHAVQNTQIDFVFLVFYSLLLFVLCYNCSLQQSGIQQIISQLLSIGALKAGLLDVAENLLLLHSLEGHRTDLVAGITWLLASVKFVLVAVVILWLMVCYALQVFKSLRA